MRNECQTVVFSNKAYNAIIRESFDKNPVETGGILLGHILDNGVWIVMEVLPPGIKSTFEIAYFEYDDAFVNYLAQSVANQYQIPLELLGLWHRHPGSMDVFSSTDDGTNTTFALQNPNGVISGLVNIDPRFRLTMYHLDNPRNAASESRCPQYTRVDIEVGDDIIPEEYFRLKYYNGEGSNLNPRINNNPDIRPSENGEPEKPLDIRSTIEGNLNRNGQNGDSDDSEEGLPSWINDIRKILDTLKKNKMTALILLILVIVFIFSFKPVIEYCKTGIDTVISWFRDDDEDKPDMSENEKTMTVSEESTPKTTVSNDVKVTLPGYQNSGTARLPLTSPYRIPYKITGDADSTLIEFRSEDTSIATISDDALITPVSVGNVKIIVSYNGQDQDTLSLTITK